MPLSFVSQTAVRKAAQGAAWAQPMPVWGRPALGSEVPPLPASRVTKGEAFCSPSLGFPICRMSPPTAGRHLEVPLAGTLHTQEWQ